jgi:serine/threonine protein kinase
VKPVCLPEKYEIIGELGSGGMGLVYHARDRVLDREVALKVLADQLAANPDFVQRFLTEARAAASLNHPNIVQIYDFGKTGNGHYLAMELIRGHSLKAELKKVGRFSEAHTIELVLTACRTLAVAHRAGIVHRDVKPDNMMFTEHREFKLVDLGLAKTLDDDDGYTRIGQSLGTPHFISPEQIKGAGVIDARADIYSLGATMYNFATGHVPFDGTSGAHIMARHLNDPLTDPRKFAPDLSDGFCRILGRMMAKDPADRFQDMSSLEKELLVLQGGGNPQQIPAVPAGVQGTVFSASPAVHAVHPPVIWDAESLKKVTRRLAEYVGPLARILVRQSRKTAESWDELSRELAGNITGPVDRAAFLRACARIGEGGGTSALIMPTGSSGDLTQTVDTDSLTMAMNETAVPTFELDDDETARVVKLLTERIGPVAPVLVKREMKKAGNLADLTANLAQAIPDEHSRRSFFEAMSPSG